MLLPELQRYKDTVRCVALGAEVPGHRQQLTQTLIVHLLKTHFFTHRSLIVKRQQNIIELVAKPNMQGQSMDLRLESQYEEAKLTWASKEKQLAVFLLKDLEQKISLALESPATPGVDKQSLKSMHPLVLSKLGKWSLELRSESSRSAH